MKTGFWHGICTILLIMSFSSGYASTKTKIIIDSVKKIKDDEEGKLVILKKNKQVLYLRLDHKNFESLFLNISKSQRMNSILEFKLDKDLNILEVSLKDKDSDKSKENNKSNDTEKNKDRDRDKNRNKQ